jgi:hypothetical protein
VWKRGCFAMEYKKRHANLGAALKQLLNYVGALANPPLLLTCDTPPGPNCLLAGLHQALCQARQERRGRRRCLLRSDVTPRNALRSGQERGAESDADAAQDARLLVKQRTMSVKRAPRPSFGVRHYCRQGKLSSAMCGRFTRSPPAKAIAGRAAGQDQRAVHQHVGVGDPLSPFDGRGQIRLNGWQGNSDHGAVDESHTRAQDGSLRQLASACESCRSTPPR